MGDEAKLGLKSLPYHMKNRGRNIGYGLLLEGCSPLHFYGFDQERALMNMALCLHMKKNPSNPQKSSAVSRTKQLYN